MKERKSMIKSRFIGINNTKFNIPINSPITINHLISLKLYTDFGTTQKEFKAYCRKCSNDHEVVKKSSEFAHWFRYLKESCTFYGTPMKKRDCLYRFNSEIGI